MILLLSNKEDYQMKDNCNTDELIKVKGEKLEIKEQIATFKKMTNGYKLTFLIIAAKQIKIFDCLTEKPKSLKRISSELNISEKRIEPILNGLVSNKLISKNKEYYFLEEYKDILSKTSEMNQLGYLDLAESLINKYMNLTSAIKNPETAIKNFQYFTEKEAESFMNGMESNAKPQVEFIKKNYNFTNHKILDIGAGSGIYLVTLATEDKTITGKMIDLEEMIKIEKKKIKKENLSDRIICETKNYNQDFPNDKFDDVFLFAIIHQEPKENLINLLNNINRVLNPNGRLFLTSFFLNEDKISPEFSVQFSIEMLLNSDNGKVYTHNEINELLANAGFNKIERVDSIPGPATLYIATK